MPRTRYRQPLGIPNHYRRSKSPTARSVLSCTSCFLCVCVCLSLGSDIFDSCMVPGFQNDDRWRMVEDEFVAVAHKFTAHLHASEYQRLKKLAREQKTDAVLSISRSVTAPMTSAVRRRQAARSLEASQTRGIKRALSKGTNADDKEGGDEIPWAGTNLHTLMESPRKKPVSLSKLLPASTSNTRAAALNRQNAASSGTEPARPSRRITPTAAPSKPPSHHSTAPPAASSRPLTTATRDVSAAPDGSTQDDDDSDSDGYSARRRRRRAERARGRHKTTPEVTDTEENRSNHSSNQKSMGQHAWSIPSI